MTIFKVTRIYVFLIILSITVVPVHSQNEEPIRAQNYVTDAAAILTPSQLGSLNSKLNGFENSTSNQIFVYVDDSLKGRNLETYTNQLFNEWQVGQKGKDNGVLITIFISDRKFRIETGYGLEGRLPDLVTKKIQDKFMGPYFKEQKYYEGINSGVDELIATIKGERPTMYEEEEPVAEEKRGSPTIQAIIAFGCIIGFYLGAFFLMKKYKGRQRSFFYVISSVALVIFFIRLNRVYDEVEATFIRNGIALLGGAIFIYALTYRGICQKNDSPKMRNTFYVLAFISFVVLYYSVLAYVTNDFEDELRGRGTKEGMQKLFTWTSLMSVALLGAVSLWNGNWELGSSSSNGDSDSGGSSGGGGFSGGGGGRSGGGGSSSSW